MSGKVTSNASPSLGANMPPAMQNQAGNFIMNPSMSPAGGYGGGKSFGAEPTSTTSNQPFTPTPYEAGPIRTQTERFRGANVGRPPRAGELYGPVAPTMPTPVPDMPITETTPGIEIGFGMDPTVPMQNELQTNSPGISFGFGTPPTAQYTNDVSSGIFDESNSSEIPMIQPAGTYTTAQTPNPFSPAPNLFNDIRQY